MQLLRNNQVYACFIYLSQAFDSPPHHLLWNVLLSVGVSPRWLRICAYIYENAQAHISTSNGLTEPTKIRKDVLKGESASLSIFNLVLELEKTFGPGIHLMRLIVAYYSSLTTW